MPTTDHDRARKTLLEWALRSEWDDVRQEVFDRHLGSTLEAFDMAPEEVSDLIGADRFATVVGWTMEALVATPLDESGRTIVDAYLERRGRRENKLIHRYMQALRIARASLYEVLEVVPRRHIVVRDLLRPSLPVTVRSRTASDSVDVGDRVALRLLDMSGEIRLAGAGLVFDPEAADGLLDLFERAAAVSDTPADADGDDAEALRAMRADPSPWIAAAWLFDLVSVELGPEGEADTANGDAPALYRVTFPLTGPADTLRQRLSGDPRFEREDSEREMWEVQCLLPDDDGDGEDADEASLLDRVIEMELTDGQLHIVSGSDVGRARATEAVTEACAGLLGPGIESVVTIGELRSLLEMAPDDGGDDGKDRA